MSRAKKRVYKVILLLIALALIVVPLTVGVVMYISFDLPDVKQLINYAPPIPSQILSKDGEVLLTIGKERREMVEIKDIPQRVIDAFLASEDNNFYHHRGVDYFGILRALVADVKAGRFVQGGSTITQQVAKSIIIGREKSFSRKIKDFLLAQKIEQVFTKEEILYLYLNHVYLGSGYYGVKAAFRGYFDKELSEVTVAEAALVVGLLVAPGKYAPHINPEQARRRQIYVLGRMLEDKKITKETYEKAINESIKIALRPQDQLKGGHFTDWIRQRVQNLVGEEAFLTQGIRVVTTLDWSLQQLAEKELLKGVKELDKRQGFVGPLKHLKDEDAMNTFVVNFRENFFKERSTYFMFTPKGEKEYELSFMKKEWSEIRKNYLQKKLGKNIKHFRPGLISDKMTDFLETETFYEAVVEDLDSAQQIIYISIGGVKGMIPYEEYRWAHKRSYDDNTHYFPYISNPNDIVKKGDVISITLVKKEPELLWDHLSKKYKDKLTDSQLISDLKGEHFLLCRLDQVPEVQGSLVGMNVKTGELLTMVGGNDFRKSQFNRATQAVRQSGSAFKPFVYAAALERGYTPASIIMDTPEALVGVDENSNWKPRNYDGKFNGPTTFRKALEMSRNIPTIKIAEAIGMDKLQKFVKRFGLPLELKDFTVVLGSFGITLIDMVSAYNIFANAGKKVYPKSIVSITDRSGKNYQLPDELHPSTKGESVTVKEPKNQFLNSLTDEQVYDPRLAYIMTNLLKGVIQSGTAVSARSLGKNVVGKTGTTNSYVDAWFVGYSPAITLGVWTGFDDNKSLGWPETGAKATLPIWMGVMKGIQQKYGQGEFEVPDGVMQVAIDPETGKALPSGTQGAYWESFVIGTAPGEASVGSVTPATPQGEDGNEEFKEIFEEDEYYQNQ